MAYLARIFIQPLFSIILRPLLFRMSSNLDHAIMLILGFPPLVNWMTYVSLTRPGCRPFSSAILFAFSIVISFI